MSPALRRTAAGVLDQVVSSASNYLTAFLAALVLAPERFGRFVLAYAVVTVLLAGARAVVGEPLLAHLATVPAARRDALAASALGTAVVLGLVGAAVCLVGALSGAPMLAALLAFVPWIPAVLVADAARYVMLARRDTGSALLVDGIWAVAQGAVLLVVWATRSADAPWSSGLLAAAWGVGAAAAALTGLALLRERPTRPGPWWAESRYLSGWFTLTSVLGQTQIYLVLLLAGATLSATDTAGLRAVQLLVWQPAITLMAALLVMVTPLMARLSIAEDLTAFYRARRRALAVMAGVGLVVLLAVPLRSVLLDLLFPRYTAYAGLVVPIALQTAVGALTVPFQAQIRGFRRGRVLFTQQLVQAGALVGGASLGLALGGVRGLAWGLMAGAVVALGSILLVTSGLRPEPVRRDGLVAATAGGVA